MIHVYYSYLSEENHKKLLIFFLPKLSIYFQKKIKKYKRWQDIQLSLLGRVLLYKGIEDIELFDPYAMKIKYTKYNKPYIHNETVKFNISHSGEMVVCVLCNEYEIGVDLELITSIDIDDFKFQMTKNEYNKIVLSNNLKETFFNYWTQKESVIKAYGQGLSMPLNSFEISNNKTVVYGEKYFLKEIMLDNRYKCYICSNRDIDKISIKTHNINSIINLK